MSNSDFDEEYWDKVIDQLLKEMDNTDEPNQEIQLIKDSITYLHKEIEKIKSILQIS